MTSDAMERARRALEEGRDDDLHAALAAAWRERRAPVLARLAELAHARSPAPFRARLDALAAPRVAVTLERFAALADADEPLLASWILRALESPPFTGPSSRPLLEALVEAASRLRDPRLVDRADAIARVWELRVTPKPARVALTKRLREVAQAIAAEPPRAATEEEARIEAAIAKGLGGAAKEARALADLYADVYANPAEDAPRLVLADALLERGDPRGELIMLQFARRDGTLGPEGALREKELLKKHGKEWLGPLAPVVSWGKGYAQSTFERGFLADADIILSVGKKLALVLEEPSWGVVERLLGSWREDVLDGVPTLLLHAPLNALREVELPARGVKRLAERGRVFARVRRLEVDTAVESWSDVAQVFPALETLVVMSPRGPSVELVARVLAGARVRRVVFDRWFLHPSQPYEPAASIDELVRAAAKLSATAPEVALVPVWSRMPKPPSIELRAKGGRYEIMEAAPSPEG
ncbi:MAG: TIGR02996 domain-containing protein [Labilithrix sp.]|nr:TIGR02996 domain-containing protein [Labilithrix sp.]MCW5817414.1 TIGR02996 domain-containing protein [Labilithrix sp.]